MRTYPYNSPQAAARIVALALLADGHLRKAELDTLGRLGADEQLGLRAGEFPVILNGLCDDLLSCVNVSWATACRVDLRTLGCLIAEVDDPGLRVKVLHLCAAVVEADGQVVEGESSMLVALVEQWGLQREMLRPKRRERVVEHV